MHGPTTNEKKKKEPCPTLPEGLEQRVVSPPAADGPQLSPPVERLEHSTRVVSKPPDDGAV